MDLEANILIDDDGHVRLTDFGLSIFIDATAHSTTGQGSLRWMAPELIDPASFGFERATKTQATDVYAFACLCVELYSGRVPFWNSKNDIQAMLCAVTGGRPSRPTKDDEGGIDMPDDLWELVVRSWSHSPAERPSMSEVSGSWKTLARATNAPA